MTFTDPECVSALNSCLDLAKWNALPSPVRDRIAELLRKHRLGVVCFMGLTGFGLRVYKDNIQCATDGDEVTNLHPKNTTGNNNHVLDLCGYWLRCPGEDFAIKEEFIVMDEYGRRFYDGDVTAPWNNMRAEAKRMPKAEAQEVADKVNGVVVKAPVKR